MSWEWVKASRIVWAVSHWKKWQIFCEHSGARFLLKPRYHHLVAVASFLFRLIKQRRSGRSLRKFSWAKFQCCLISLVSERRTKEGSKVLVFKPPRKDFACETFVIKDYEIRSWLWMSLNILCRGKFSYNDDWSSRQSHMGHCARQQRR